jgi:ribonucleoside-diphosphate reductase alpha chain
MKLNENALEVLRDRYLWAKKSGALESPEQMFKRVAFTIAGSSKSLQKKFLSALTNLEFLPNTPTLMNAGRKDGQLAACFVLPLEDDLSKIMNTLKATALIHQSGGGTGFNFSRLRSAESVIGSSRGKASGPIGFLSLFNELTQTIKQGGLRRGANMGILSVTHPDIKDFIHCKTDTSKITNFNISVSIPDKFMTAVTIGDPNARNLFKLICEAAHKTGEPGLIFIDEINRKNPTPNLGAIEATNPCGEQPLLPFEACNLGSINLNKILKTKVTQNMSSTEALSNLPLQIDWQKLSELVETGVLFLDRVIDVCHYPLPEITKICRHNRKIGLGVMGLADMFLKLKIQYDSPEALELSEKLMGFIHSESIKVSQALAKQKGAFQGFRQSLWHKKGVKPLRNATLTTIAPTGTISLIAGASAGIEPIFSYVYDRHVLDGKVLHEIHPKFKELIELRGLSDLSREQALIQAARAGSIKSIRELSLEDKKIFVTARDISAENHVRMQAAFQKYSDSAVSKTINLPASASVEDVEKAYLLAHKLKCKGITVYRDTSRPNQVLKLIDCDDCSINV